MNKILSVMGLFVSLGVWANVVSINPPSGESTNVVARLTGADSVVVNSGETGGGIVRLNSANTYSGGTTLNSGTLVIRDGAGAKGMSDLGTGDVLYAEVAQHGAAIVIR